MHENGVSLNYVAGYREALEDFRALLDREMMFSEDREVDADYLAVEITGLEEKLEQRYKAQR